MNLQNRNAIFVVLASCCLAAAAAAGNRVKRQSSPPEQPRIVTTDGHLVFQTGANHNISFRSSTGGSVNIDGTDVKAMSQKVDVHQTKLQVLDGIQERVGGYKAEMDVFKTSVNDQFSGVNTQMNNATRQISRLDQTIRNTRKFDRLKNKVGRIQTSVNTINTKLRFDNCATGPCENAGTCVDMYDTFRCFCPINWQGTTCNQDVNECAIYQGTAQGCHSGATCLNTNGGFSCTCPDGFTGVLCNVKAGTCTEGSNSELCGHGTCIDQAPSHTCICDDGWTRDTATPPRCTIDVNECDQVNKPCHDNVQCINVPGNYFCGPCPIGFSGNGHQCNDINECLVLNGGCSINPRVDCINTLGSRSCGPCPSGYEKTPGEACIWVGVCHINNGGCNINAQCLDNPSLPTRSCRCNPGYTGLGEGNPGCTAIDGGVTPSPDPCTPNPCQNGNCFSLANSNAFTCSCLAGWTGHLCQDDINECSSSICQNGGTCTNTDGNYTCTCTAYASGRNCQTPTYRCGGQLRGTTGSFTFPPAQHDAYPHDVSCAWRITTDLNKILKVTFTRFALERHSNCEYDFLQIHDGGTASAHQIGKYCGNDTVLGLQGKTITSTHNLLYMWFKADQTINDQGFAFTWRSETPECGYDIRNQTIGSIISPGYPGPYPANRTCVWTIRLPPGNNIQVTTPRIDIETHANCSYDYLEFRNGLRDTDRLLQRVCSQQNHTVVTTEGNELYIKFHSDPSVTGSGFQLTWLADPIDPGCGGTLNLTDGVLISPDHPNHYPHTRECVWVITVPANARIALNFTDFDLEGSFSCNYDFLEIHDGPDDTSDLFGRFCGSEIPGLITSSTNNLYLRFRTDASVNGRGFRATWTVACGGTFSDQTGVMISPYWPNAYPHAKVCRYQLSARDDQVVEVTFTHFSVEASSNQACTYDNLIAFDGITGQSDVLGTMCGSSLPIPLISTGPNMLLIFTSDGSITDLGFRATYEFRNTSIPVIPSTCGGILTNGSGTIVSPGHPNFYPHGVDCLWEIRVSPGFQIRLTFNFFSIETIIGCSFDYVQVSNNRTDNTTTNLSKKSDIRLPGKNASDSAKNETSADVQGRYCGSSTPPAITSIGNMLFVRFKADSSIAHEGFSANYVSFNHSWCGDERRTLPGVISSPNYPENYPHQRECIWTIVAEDNHQIVLNITDFAMEEHSNCNYDYVEIRNGGNELSPLIGRYCGNEIINPMYSQSNRLWIKFKSDVSDSSRGFSIWYEVSGQGCGADLTGPSGVFLSPNYPASYGRNAECYWTITVAQGSSILLLMVSIDLESHANCLYDYVEAIEGLHTGPVITKVCGNVPPQPIRSQGNVMTVKFRSDSSLGGNGFHAVYHAVCQNRVLNSSSGVIESPNFPDNYPHNRNCSWIINAPLGNVLTVSFSHFEIEADIVGSACHNDFLEIRDGTTPTSNLLQVSCGSDLPPALNSTSSSLYIRFKSDASLAHNGFRLEYATIARVKGTKGTNSSNIGCGGDLNTETGSFTSPNYPQAYPHNRECVWRITVPAGNRIQLQFNNVDMEFHTNCSYDFLEVLGGPDANSPPLTKICQDSKSNHTVTSSGNQMYIKFRSDSSSTGTGFTANYSSIAGGCGGTFTTPSGTIQSPNHPNNYPHSTNCEWNITVAAFQTVQITFKDFDIEDHSTCLYDYVAIYDGLDENAGELGKLCGQNLTDHTYSSTGRSLRVKMRSDVSGNGRGFIANYITSCGGRMIVGEGIGIIRSPNFPDNYNPNTNCTWTLMGTLAVDRITLQFTHMDLEVSDESQGICAHDSVSVLQGDNIDAPQQGIYCGTGIPHSITSTSYALTVVFRSDPSLELTGFSASYSKSTSFCGGNLTATHGAFSTPNFPDSYPRNAECIWYLNASPGNQIQLSFGSFDLEQTDGCARDYVEVREGDNINNVLGRYCGSDIPSNVTVAKSMYVKFRSDGTNSFAGFTAQFSTLTGGDLVGSEGQLASPLYPRPYPHNSHHVWSIIVPIGQKVRIEFNDLDIETGLTCAYDYIQFLDGTLDSGAEELLKTCGTTPPAPFSSTGNVMTVIFHSDVSATGRGFLLSWSAVDQIITTPGTTLTPPTQPDGCNYNLVATEEAQNISNPGYPGYENRADCTWVIRSPNGASIQLIIQEMVIESSVNCVFDALRIYDGSTATNSRLLSTQCGRITAPLPPFTTTIDSMLLKFTTDSSVALSGFQGIFKTTCGGMLTDPSGVITSPRHPNTYAVNSSCQWIIAVAAGRTIELSVDSFSLPNSVNCTGDRLRILNGNNANSPHIETDRWAYCGGQAPSTNGVLTSASRYMYIEFISDSQTDGGATRNFQISYTEKSVLCGGNFLIPDDDSFVGSFSSPGFGGQGYPHNADCTWVITGPSNVRVQLDFLSFELEKHSTCNYDYVLIRDGGTENSPPLARLCGGENQPTVRSSNNVIRVRLITDDTIGRGGFNITFKKETCGGTLIGTTGDITSPQYPNNYPANANCEWYLEAPVGHYISMNFTAFRLGNSAPTDNCTGQDALTLYNRDRFGNMTNLVDSYCGNRAPLDIRTADSKAFLKFTSDSTGNFPGFSMSFFASVETCGGQLTNPSGLISSPNYPGYYAHSRDCRWFITAPAGKRVTLTFLAFEIEAQASCLYDYVEVFNGHMPRSPRLGRYCGNVTDNLIESTSTRMMIHFNSDGSVSNGGFRLSYTTSQPIVCGGVISPALGEIGQIISPGYEETILSNGNINLTGSYLERMECEWKIQGGTTVNSSIVIKFQPNRFKLEHDGECRYDFLELREGLSSAGQAVGRFCSNLTNNVPTQVSIPGNQMWLAFVSDSSIQHEGFNVTYQFAPCGGILRGDIGVITSPNYPQPYNHDMGCAWEIVTEEGRQIELTINAFDIESSDKCEFDYLALYNGGSHKSPLMTKICKSDSVNNVYTSASNVLRIEFMSDASQSGNGFSMSYRTKSQGCGGVFNDLTGNISTQNYPNNYPHNVECVWDIMVPDGYHVVMATDGVFDIESGGSNGTNCFYDYVQFFSVDVNGDATELGRKYCGSVAPPTQESGGNHMRVKFRADQWTNGVGFNLVWTAGCGGTFNTDSGVIFSPGYPNNYQHNLSCDYTIIADPSQFIVLQFDESNFRIETGSSCQYDSVAVYEGNATGRFKGRFCGLTPPEPVATRGSMLVRFITDADTADDGFKATFVTSDCGGYFNESVGVIKSPTHPVDYHNNLNCTWSIEVAENKAVNLRFEEFDVEGSSNGNCRYDYLAVYDGGVANLSNLIGQYCGDALPENVRSTSSRMTIVFRTDASVTKGGFRAIYTETYGPAQGCGGMLNGTSGTITPPRDLAGDYLSDLDCIWFVTVPDNKVLSLQITSIAIEEGDSCLYDGLEIFDGISSEDPKLSETICGSLRDRQHLTATNMMKLRFYSDGSVGATGFTINFSAVDPVCGGVFNINETAAAPVTITSPQYPSIPNTHPVNCRWTIGVPFGKQVRITVTDLSITGGNNCDTNFLQLKDQPAVTNDGPGQKLQFCNTTTPYVFDSYGSEAEINFKFSAPATPAYRGFELNYAIASCNRTLTHLDGRVTSPGWPTRYPHGMNCLITIAIPDPSKRIALYFYQFDIEDHNSCQYDYIELFDGSLSNSIGKHCGSSIPQPIISNTSTVILQVVSDNSVALGGFELTYVASATGCGGTLTATSGTFSNPLPGTSSCEWIINLPVRRRPTLQFPVMDLRQNNTACPGAYVEVRNGGHSLAPLMGKFCDGSVPTLTGGSNKLYIKFVANTVIHSEAKFTARYTSGDQGTFVRTRAHVLSSASIFG